MDDVILTQKQAYVAMYYFLHDLQLRTHSDDLASFLGDIQINKSDGEPMDPAMWQDWLQAVKKVSGEIE